MKRILPVVFIFVLSSLISCKSGQKAFKNGDYYLAVVEAIDRLQGNPDHKKATRILQEGYPLAVNWYITQAQNKVDANDRYKWESVVLSYDRINQMYEAVKRSPAAMRIVKDPINFYPEIGEAQEKAAEVRYKTGIYQLDRNTRESAKEAYYHFDRADQLVAGYRDVKEQLIAAQERATLRILVKQIPIPSRRYRISAEFFQNQLDEYLANNNRNRFLRFYTDSEKDQLQKPDQTIHFRFDDFAVGQTYIHEKERTVTSKDSVELGQVTLEDGTKKKAYGLVNAQLITFKKQVLSAGVLNMMITDGSSGAFLANDRFPGEFDWFCEWAAYNGDIRALTDEQVHLCNVRPLPPPPPQDMFIEFTRPIFNQVTARLNRMYKNY